VRAVKDQKIAAVLLCLFGIGLIATGSVWNYFWTDQLGANIGAGLLILLGLVLLIPGTILAITKFGGHLKPPPPRGAPTPAEYAPPTPKGAHRS